MRLTKLSIPTPFLWFAVFIIASLIASYVRLYPLRGHIWSPTHEQATLLVIYNIKQDLLQEIHRQSPQMPQAAASRLAEDKLNETLHTKSAQVRQAIEKVNTQMAKGLGGKEPVYLLESDPFYFYNLTQNIVDKGRIADTAKGSKYFNPLMAAPFGDWQPFTIHPYIGFVIYKTIQSVIPDIPLMHALGFTPIIISILALIPFLWICRMLSLSPFTSLGASIIFTLSPIYLKRSAFGWYDTDPYNILLPLLMLSLLVWGFQKKEITQSIKTGIILGLAVCLHALIWQGWGFMFFVSLASIVAAILYAQFIIKDNLLRNQGLILLLTAIVTTTFSISLIFGVDDFFVLIKEGLGELNKFTDKGINLWPNLFIGVGELNKSTGQGFSNAVGGWITLGLGASGVAWIMYQAFKNPRHPLIIAHGLIAAFLTATCLVTIGAERFALFTLIPLGLLSALCLHFLGLIIKQQLAKRPSWMQLAPGLALVILLWGLTTKGNVDIQSNITPIFNAAWDQALLEVNDKTPPDSIINTWWAPGHFIKGIAQRRVPFDGASLDEGAVGYWMSNILLSPDEAHARGLTRMLNLSGNRAAQYLSSCGLKTSLGATLLHAIASKSTTEAALYLKPFLQPPQITHLLNLTHGGQPHSYILLYNELVDDNLILKFTGGWDFKKIEALNENPQLLKEIPNRNSPGFIDFLWGIAGGPSKYSNALPFLGEQNNFLLFKEKLAIDMQTMDATIDSPQFGNGKPLSVVYLNGDHITEHVITGGQLNYSVLLYKEEGQYMARLMDRSLANSLIIRLFFFDGVGMKYFKPFTSTHDLTGRTRIKIFEVIWE